MDPNLPADIEEQRALAAATYPDQWAKALLVTGRRGIRMRASLRHRAISERTMAPIRAAGGACANCTNRLRNPAGLKGLFCDLRSDFHGYQTTAPDGLCADYRGEALTALPGSADFHITERRA